MCPVSMVTPVLAAGAGGKEEGCRFSPTDGGSCGDPVRSGAREGADPQPKRELLLQPPRAEGAESTAASPGFVGCQGARSSAPCSGPRRRGRPLARGRLAGPASPGWASTPDGCARGRGARRGAADLGALPRR